MKNLSVCICQWDHCDTLASGHVWFGLRVGATGAGNGLTGIAYETEHRDLCGKHTTQVRRQYVHVTAFDLNEA